MIHSTLNDPDGLNRHFRLCPSLNPVAGLHMIEYLRENPFPRPLPDAAPSMMPGTSI